MLLISVFVVHRFLKPFFGGGRWIKRFKRGGTSENLRCTPSHPAPVLYSTQRLFVPRLRSLTLFELQSRCGDKPLKSQALCPQKRDCGSKSYTDGSCSCRTRDNTRPPTSPFFSSHRDFDARPPARSPASRPVPSPSFVVPLSQLQH